jgi:hypothetical protein
MVMGSEALDGFIDSLRIDSANPNARFYLMQVATAQVRLFKDWKEPDKAEAVIRKVLEVLPDAGELRGIMAPGTPGE